MIRPRPTYEQIGESAGARQTAYRELFGTALPEDDVRDIRDATQNAWALGRPDFQRTISRLARRAQRAGLAEQRLHHDSGRAERKLSARV